MQAVQFHAALDLLEPGIEPGPVPQYPSSMKPAAQSTRLEPTNHYPTLLASYPQAGCRSQRIAD